MTLTLRDMLKLSRIEKKWGCWQKARMGSLPFHIETGCYRFQKMKDSACQSCGGQLVEDVIHLLVYCTKYNDITHKVFDDIVTGDNFMNDLSEKEVIKLLLANDNTITMLATAKFLHNALTIRSCAS